MIDDRTTTKPQNKAYSLSLSSPIASAQNGGNMYFDVIHSDDESGESSIVQSSGSIRLFKTVTLIYDQEERRKGTTYSSRHPCLSLNRFLSVALVRYQSFSISRRISSPKTILSFILPLGNTRIRRRPSRRTECEGKWENWSSRLGNRLFKVKRPYLCHVSSPDLDEKLSMLTNERYELHTSTRYSSEVSSRKYTVRCVYARACLAISSAN